MIYDDFSQVSTIGRITPITDKDQEIPLAFWDPHYTDRRFTQGTVDGLTIFVDPSVHLVPSTYVDEISQDLTYSYIDRLATALGEKIIHEARISAAAELGTNRTARFAEHMLRYAFQDESLFLGHLRAGVNRSDGYAYHIYGYRRNGSK